jgi:hypothetical protein
MVEDSAPLEVSLLLIELDDLYLVLGVFNEGTQRQTELLLCFVAEVNGVESPV